MGERSPIYNKPRTGRVISGPNGTWIPQEHKPRGASQGTRELDCWRATYRPQATKQAAMACVPEMPNG